MEPQASWEEGRDQREEGIWWPAEIGVMCCRVGGRSTVRKEPQWGTQAASGSWKSLGNKFFPLSIQKEPALLTPMSAQWDWLQTPDLWNWERANLSFSATPLCVWWFVTAATGRELKGLFFRLEMGLPPTHLSMKPNLDIIMFEL